MLDHKEELERLVKKMSRPKNLLIVDDDRALVEVIESYCQEMKMNVTVAHTPEEGIAAFDGGDFDLALIDLVFPGGSRLDGIDVIRHIREKHPISPPIWLLTGYPNHKRLAEMGDIGGPVTLVPKPFKNFDLPELLTAVIRAGGAYAAA